MNKEYYMGLAIKQAEKSLKINDVPVGAVIVKNGKVIASAFNTKEKKQVATFHAEILCINKACKKLKSFRLEDCDIYVTKEPCIMCMGAILSARIKTLYFGAYDKKYSTIDKIERFDFNHKVEIIGGVLQKENEEILTNYFKKLRKENASNRDKKNKLNNGNK